MRFKLTENFLAHGTKLHVEVIFIMRCAILIYVLLIYLLLKINEYTP